MVVTSIAGLAALNKSTILIFALIAGAITMLIGVVGWGQEDGIAVAHHESPESRRNHSILKAPIPERNH